MSTELSPNQWHLISILLYHYCSDSNVWTHMPAPTLCQHNKPIRSVPMTLVLGQSGAATVGLVQPCPKPRTLFHKPGGVLGHFRSLCDAWPPCVNIISVCPEPPASINWKSLSSDSCCITLYGLTVSHQSMVGIHKQFLQGLINSEMLSLCLK